MSSAEDHAVRGRSDLLQPGLPAPDFELRARPDLWVSLGDFRGRPLVMAFYPADWSPVCSDQMALYSLALPEFERYRADIVGISVDGVWCHLAFAADRNLRFPLLSDFEPKSEVARRYGVYDYGTGESKRALFVLDRDGVIRWSYVSPVDVNPGADRILAALEAITVPASA
jgi:peroxiredoxin